MMALKRKDDAPFCVPVVVMNTPYTHTTYTDVSPSAHHDVSANPAAHTPSPQPKT